MNLHFAPLVEADLDLLYQWFQLPDIRQLYARGKRFTLEDIKHKYLPRILGKENVPSFIIYNEERPIGFIQYYTLLDSLPEGIEAMSNPLFEMYNPNEMAGIDLFIAYDVERGQGLGKFIIHYFIETFLKNFKAIVVDPEQIIKQYDVMKRQGLNKLLLVKIRRMLS